MENDHFQTIAFELAVLARRLTAIATENKLDRSAYLLLHQITASKHASVKILAEAFQLDVSTVSRQVAALEQKGYVVRIPDVIDKRAFTLEITQLGKTELSAYKAERLSRITYLLRDWSEEERQAFGQLLTKFNRTY